MPTFKTEEILNFALVGHGGSGKTMLSESMLYNAGVVNRMGTIEDGNTVSDYHDDEIMRQISINASVLSLPWENKKFNIVDTPGYADFYGEVECGLRVADFAAVVVHAVSGIEVGTEQAWRSAQAFNLPRFIVVNLLDKENANFDAILADARDRFGSKVFPFGVPVNAGPGFNQVADVLRNELFTYKTDGTGKFTQEALSGDLKDTIKKMPGELIELVAESDDTLLEKFFEKDELTEEELRAGLHGAFLSGAVIPVFPVSAEANIGVRRMMDVLARYAPCASDFKEVHGLAAVGSDKKISHPVNAGSAPAGLVFKTISEAHLGELSFFRVYSGTIKTGQDLVNANQGRSERMGTMYSMCGKNRNEMGAVVAGDIAAAVKLKDTHTGNTLSDPKNVIVLPPINLPTPKVRSAILAKSKGDEGKISTGLSTLHEEDPTFVYEHDKELKQTIIAGQGELHLETIMKRLKSRFGVEIDLITPRVPYRETISTRGESKYRHKKQSGGAGQFAEVWMYVEPLPTGSGVQFESELKGMSIDRVFIPSIEKGVVAAAADGILAGYNCVDVKAVVYDGKQHPVDSKDIAFQIAGKHAFREAFMGAKPKLLEPFFSLEVLVPEEYMGDIMGDISSRRGKVMGMDSEGRLQKINAQVPLANLDGYATALRSMTGGRGIHTQAFDHYEGVPKDEEARVIKAHKTELEEEK